MNPKLDWSVSGYQLTMGESYAYPTPDGMTIYHPPVSGEGVVHYSPLPDFGAVAEGIVQSDEAKGHLDQIAYMGLSVGAALGLWCCGVLKPSHFRGANSDPDQYIILRGVELHGRQWEVRILPGEPEFDIATFDADGQQLP